jgi:hypothetical protein
MTHSSATVLIDVEVALRSRSRVLATTRVDRERVPRLNPGVFDGSDGNFSILIIYTGIAVKICLD